MQRQGREGPGAPNGTGAPASAGRLAAGGWSGGAGGAGGGPSAAGPGGQWGRGRREKPNFKMLGRAMRYLGRYRRLALTAYLLLFASSAAQLMVPQLVQRIIDAVTQGFAAQRIATLPAQAQAAALTALHWTPDDLVRHGSGA